MSYYITKWKKKLYVYSLIIFSFLKIWIIFIESMYIVCTLWCLQDEHEHVCVLLLRLQCCVLMLVMVPCMRAHEPIGLSRGQATKVCNWHGHLGSSDAVCPPASIKVHSQAGHWYVPYECVWSQTQLHALGGTFAVLDPVASPTPARTHGSQLWAVESPLQQAEALRLSAGTVIQGLLVAQGSPSVYALHRWEVVRVHTTGVSLVANSGHTVAKGCKR